MNRNVGLDTNEWMGTKPIARVRWIAAVVTASVIATIVLYGVVERALGTQSVAGGMLIGIFSGLLASGIIAGLTWFAYDYFLPLQRHVQFRPKVNGKWFAYYPVSTEGERKVEFIYMKQVADKVSGTITSHQNAVYDFVGQLVLGTLVLTWVSHEEERNIAGAIVLRPTFGFWSGLQVAGHPDGHVATMPYVMTRNPFTDEQWFALLGKGPDREGVSQDKETTDHSDGA